MRDDERYSDFQKRVGDGFDRWGEWLESEGVTLENAHEPINNPSTDCPNWEATNG
jgi:hypothetical protein